jgi:hypothetical protein
MSFNNVGHLITKTITTLQHFTILHLTILHYTYRHFTSSHLHFTILSFGLTHDQTGEIADRWHFVLCGSWVSLAETIIFIVICCKESQKCPHFSWLNLSSFIILVIVLVFPHGILNVIIFLINIFILTALWSCCWLPYYFQIWSLWNFHQNHVPLMFVQLHNISCSVPTCWCLCHSCD